ncbi:glycoside hydrolase family 13 protein [Agrococcus sp. Marseille-Q4369]|uniref:glycoside hydrolase family 13 protein n=1 Tax=Agrococcus sp. Marseille-Q4369 TaxID=2810513 RepID=UPI001B8BE36E|nr:glycoside hydrolase family 13 protein [Agrococcus sp. Marseille-Q4369]QUW18422.1 glycoside hydrolase family 13 protein [Agrococcus sp. Marseille-Q4369]
MTEASTQQQPQSAPGHEWWRSAVIYQIYPRSFADASGDGIGDLAGITARLPHVAELGVDAIWLSPFYRSPQKDAGYDVSDYMDVDPLFGTLDDFDRMLAEAHAQGLRVIVDLVPNHSSDQHEWFQAALAAGPGSPERARYIFREGKGPGGDEPPNNWQSVFGGPAWTRVADGEWYLHLFDSSQPDFDWNNPEVGDMFVEVLRFWLDRGVDGFRVDVAHGNAKAEGLPDVDEELIAAGSMESPFFGQEHVHEIYRRWRTVLDEYEGDRVLCAEAWVSPLEKMARFVRPDEMHQAFNFVYLETPWDAAQLRSVIDESIRAFGEVGAPPTWVLSNHDTIRHRTRLALVPPPPHGAGIGPTSKSKADPTVSLRRGRAATALMLALPGSAYVYQGEELGLPEVTAIAPEQREDPTFHRTKGELWGRDGCRVPIPWESEAPAYGFSPTGETWLPQPPEWATLARDAQAGVEGSTLELYRRALALREAHGLGTGELEWIDVGPTAIGFRNGGITVIANIGHDAVDVPRGEILLASSPLDAASLAADETVWVRTA